MGSGGGLTRPLVIVGFNQMVILITYGMMYFTMEAVFVVCILAMKLASVHMWQRFRDVYARYVSTIFED